MKASNASVLIVDDSSTMRAILRDMLTRMAVRSIEEAPDGRAALAKVQQRGFSVVISDWNMEPMSGIDLLREVRRISAPGLNRFIFVTSERSWGRQTTAKLDGAEAFIIKPFSFATLQAKLATVLER